MSTITSKLDISRQTLLDLSTRNRLIHVPQNKQAKVIDIVDELSTEVFRLLVKEQRNLSSTQASIEIDSLCKGIVYKCY